MEKSSLRSQQCNGGEEPANVQSSTARPSQGADGKHRREKDEAEQSKEGFLWEEVDQVGMMQCVYPAGEAGAQRQSRENKVYLRRCRSLCRKDAEAGVEWMPSATQRL